jgi:ferredoxin
MRVEVDLATCENHGQCVFAAPAVFAFDDDEQLTYEADPATEHAEAVRAAAASCPVRAITLVEP